MPNSNLGPYQAHQSRFLKYFPAAISATATPTPIAHFSKPLTSTHHLPEDHSHTIIKNAPEKIRHIKINRLSKYLLSRPLDIVVEPDDDGFIARSFDLDRYGFGYDSIEAVENLKLEIEDLYDDLMEDDNFTEEWLIVKKFLASVVEEP